MSLTHSDFHTLKVSLQALGYEVYDSSYAEVGGTCCCCMVRSKEKKLLAAAGQTQLFSAVRRSQAVPAERRKRKSAHDTFPVYKTRQP